MRSLPPSLIRCGVAALGLAAALHLAPTRAAAQVLTFGGDGVSDVYASWINNSTNTTNQIVFDNFRVGAGFSWTVTGVYGSFFATDFAPLPSTLGWEIRQGMVQGGSVGTVVASGVGAASVAGDVYSVATGPFMLGAGEYWLGMWADLTGAASLDPTLDVFFGTLSTAGANAVNAIGDGQALWLVGADETNAGGSANGIGFDFSYGLLGQQTQVVPEPGVVGLVGAGLAGLVVVGRRARRRTP